LVGGEKGSSQKAVFAALFGNLAIAISKLFAALFTGSSSMWAETLHSFSDTVNQILLLIGLRTSKKRVSERHPFGYGKEQFFWSFVVAILIFGISGSISVQRGLESLLYSQSHHIENIGINFVILGLSFVFEAYAFRIAFLSFKKVIKERGEKFNFSTLISEIKQTKDSAVMTVLIEDTAALSGIVVATIALILTAVTGNSFFDSVGSLVIGLILMAFAVFLAKENKALLIGEAITRRDYKRINDIVSEIPEVNRIISIRSMHLAPDDVLIAIEVNLVDNLDTDKIESLIDTIENKVREMIPYANLSKIYVEIEQDSDSSTTR
jgi:cation diffusion facilitator family transporter